ncbi:MAG: YfhO family protein [Ruthenibacterium sp.]
MQKPQNEKRTLLLTALCAVGMVLCLYALLGVWPLGTGSVLTGDLNGQYISYNARFARAIFAGDSVSYTFEKQMGGSMLGILAYYCASPFNLLYLLVPVVHYAKMAGLVLALKLVCTAVAMAFFLGRHNGTLRHRAVLPALCYAFCAYFLIYAQNIMWMDVVLLLPLVCYGVDVLLETRRPFLFAAALGVAIFANFYIAYMLCVFVVLYFGYCMLGCDRALSVRRAQARGGANASGSGARDALACGSNMPLSDEQSIMTRGRFWLTRCASFAFGALCAGGMACVLLIPAMADISQNKGLAGGAHFSGAASFKLTEFFYRLLPFNFTWADAENGLPNVYCGTLAIVLAVLYFCAKGISRSEKLRSAAMTALLFLTLYSADAALAMHGFVKPVWFPYRHAFLFSFWLCFLAARALGQGARVTARGAVCGGAAGLCFLSVCFFVRNEWFTATLFGVGALLCGACFVLVFALQNARSRRVRGACFAALGVLCMAELTANGFFEMNQFEKYPEPAFVSFVQDGTQALHAIDTRSANEENDMGRSAYRTEKAWYRSYNDPMLLDYNGLSHFGSTQDSTVVMWLSHLGFGSTNAYAPGSTAFAESLCALRWCFARSAEYPAANGAADAVPAHDVCVGQTDAGLSLYENPYALPVAFYAPLTVQDSALVLRWDEGMCSTFEVQNTLFCTLAQTDAPLFTDVPVQAVLDGAAAEQPVGEFKKSAEFTAAIPQDGLAYAVFESKSGNPVLLTGDAPDAGYFAGRSTGVLQLGRCKAGDVVKVGMTPEWGLADVTKVRFCVMDEGLLADYSARTNKNAPVAAMTAEALTATAAVQAETLLVMSAPYSDSLVMTVDGEETAIVPLLSKSYCGAVLPAGTHTITLRYRAKGAGIGLALTCSSLAALAAAWLWTRKKRGRALKSTKPCKKL